MKKITSAIGGILGALTRGRDSEKKMTARSVVVRAGADFGTEAAFEQLEQRQLLFGMTITPTPGLPIPGSGGLLAPDMGLANQTLIGYNPATGTGAVQTTFGYLIPFLRRQVPDFQAPGTAEENFDQFAPQALPVAGDQSGAVIFPESQLRLSYTDVPATIPPPALVLPPAPAAGTPQGTAVRLTLQNGTAAANNVFQTNAPIYRFGFAAGDSLRWMLAFSFDTYTGGGLDIDFTPGAANNPSMIRAFLRGVDVTANLQFTRVAPAPATDPATVRYTITQVPGAPAPQFFDEIRIARAGASATADTVVLDNVQGVFPAGRFAQFNEGRIFGARAQVGGTLRYGLEQMDGAAPTATATGLDFASISRLGLGSFLRTTNAGTNTTSVVGGGATGNGLQIVAANGAGNTTSLRFLPDAATGSTSPRLMTVLAFTTDNVAGQQFDDGTTITFFRNGVATPVFIDITGTTVNALTSDLIQLAQFRNLDAATDRWQYVFRVEGGFDEVRISRTGAAGNDTVVMDDIIGVFPQVFMQDLYGRALRNTLALGTIEGSAVPLVDLNDDGVPDFNDGIGRIDFFGSNTQSSFTIIGGTVAFDSTLGDFVFTPPDSLAGLYGAFAQAGFGFAVNQQGTGVVGMPPATGSVIIGAPFFRINVAANGLTAAQNYHTDAPGNFAVARALSFNTRAPLGALNFTTGRLQNNGAAAPAATPATLQGVFVSEFDNQPQNFGSINIHGALFGSSRLSGSAQSFAVGYLPGSLTIEGDVGMISVGTDAGFWLRNDSPGAPNDVRPGGVFNSTGSLIVVGRTAGQIQFGGRNAADIQVLADVNSTTRPRVDFLNYAERENVYGINPATPNPIAALYGATVGSATFGGNAGALFFGSNFYRNDLINGAEFVGSGLRGAIISGSVGAQDPGTEEDPSDVYAFAAARGQQVVVNAQFTPPPAPPSQFATRVYARIVDANGRVLAAHQLPLLADGRLPANQVSVRFTFTPTRTDVYYLVVGTQTDGTFGSTQAYTITMSGQLPVTLGAYTTGAGSRGNLLQVQSGDIGLVRIGGGIVGPDSTLATGADALGIFTYEQGADIFDVRGSVANPTGFALQAAGNVHGIIAGGNWVAGTASIGGNLGSLYTGLFTGVGDFIATQFQIGGTAGLFDIRGSVAYTTTATALRTGGPGGPNTFVLTTGANGTPGHIGALLVGGLLNGQAFVLNTSANTIVDRFVIGSQPGVAGANNGRIILFQPTLNMGAGSDIRFASFQRVSQGTPGTPPDGATSLTLAFNQTLELVDDSGARIRIRIESAFLGANTSAGVVTVIQGPNGVIIGSINATLNGGANLIIEGVTAGRATIGAINLTTDGGTRRSSVIIRGNTQIDVLSIQQPIGATGLADIINETTGGDIIAVDVLALNRLIVRGSLGRTETNGVGDDLLGPNLGIGQAGQAGAPGTPLSLPDNAYGSQFQGGVLVPINWNASEENDRTIEDIGSPLSGLLNGAVVRTGNLLEVNVRGALGDLIMQDFTGPATGNIRTIIVNSDGVSTPGVFEGIVGVVIANNITTLDVGSGIAGPGSSPFAAAGVFAYDDIETINAGLRVLNPRMNGIVIAADRFALGTAGETGVQGIGTINIRGGTIDGMYIASATFDSWWLSARYAEARDTDPGDPPQAIGTVRTINITHANFVRSTIYGRFIDTVRITNGVWDASTAQAQGGAAGPNNGFIGTITADAFINSTRDGEPLEYRFNQIRASGNVGRIETTYRPNTGNIEDMFLDITGNITGRIGASNIVRLAANVGGQINQMLARQNIRSSTINAGRIVAVNAELNIAQSTFTTSGRIDRITARGDISGTSINSDGPNGSIILVQAGNSITDASIVSSGIIGRIQADRGDITGVIRTTDETDGDLQNVRAGRDLGASLNIARDVGTIQAGRNIGRRLLDGSTPDVIRVYGNLSNLTAGGQLYADLNVGWNILGTVSIGRVYALPNPSPNTNNEDRDRVSDAVITAYGRINNIVIVGDFAGSIISFSGGINSVTINAGSFRRFAPGVTPVPGVTPANRIEARDGDINNVTINRGHLLGDVIALNGSINNLRVNGDGVFGAIGVDSSLSQNSSAGVPGNEFRNQLPPGVDPSVVNGNGAQDGPTIFAGRDILNLSASRGIFEATVQAGRRIGNVNIGRGADHLGVTANPTIFIAGDRIDSITIGSGGLGLVAQGVFIGAGVTSLGADNRPGGIGANADTVRQGTIGSVQFRGAADANTVIAGVNAGAGGSYATLGDNTVANGLSTIGSVRVDGGATNNLVLRDTGPVNTTPNLLLGSNVVAGLALPGADPRIVAPPAGTLITAIGISVTIGADTVLLRYTGPGAATFDGVNTITLNGSTSGSSLTITPQFGAVSLTGLVINSVDDSSLGTLNVGLALINPNIYVDGTVNTLNVTGGINPGDPSGSGIVESGAGINSMTVGVNNAANDGTAANNFILRGPSVNSLILNGGFGGAGSLAAIELLFAGNIEVRGPMDATVVVQRDISTFRARDIANSGVTTGGRIGQFFATTLFNAVIAAGDGFGSINVTGDVDQSLFLGGTYLGADGAIGGAGDNADVLSNANVGNVFIGGNFTASDIAVGVGRGADQFFGTGDDRVADGRSNLGNVDIRGGSVGSVFGSASYRVISNGNLGTVKVNNQVFQSLGNFAVDRLRLNQPNRLSVTDVRITEAARRYTATITFNQAIDPDSIAAALSIAEIRGIEGGLTTIALVQGADYTFTYDPVNFRIVIEFNQAVTSRQIAFNADPALEVPGAAAGPGVFRFTLLATGANRLRAQAQETILDGNGNGIVGDDFVYDDVVGDAGDRFFAGRTTVGGQTGPQNTGGSLAVTFYAPVNLDLLLNRDNANANRPDANSPFTIRGTLGDHPNLDITLFNSGGDVDMYQVTLRAGQTLRLGATQGSAPLVTRTLLGPDGTAVTGQLVTGLRGDLAAPGQLSTELVFLIQQTGTYTIMVSTAALATTLLNTPTDPVRGVTDIGLQPRLDPAAVTGGNPTGAIRHNVFSGGPTVGEIGAYNFTVTVAEDGDSGFGGAAAPSTAVPNPDPNFIAPVAPPLPASFGGPQGGPYPNQVIGGFTFTLDDGADNLRDTYDDVVRGVNDASGMTITLLAGADRVFGTADDIVDVRGRGTRVLPTTGPNAIPTPSAFAGTDGLLGTVDDRAFIEVGGWTFRLETGNNFRLDGDGIVGRPSDDIVIATDAFGTQLYRTAGSDGIFNATDPVRIRTSIGDAGARGAPQTVQPDVDILTLNNGVPYAPGTRLRVTLRTADLGSNLGMLQPQRFGFANLTTFTIDDLRSFTQFALFDNTTTTGVADGDLVAAPGSIQGFATRYSQTLASNGVSSYGYDAQGNFFMEFAVPPQQANTANQGIFSMLVQGMLRTDYELEVQNLGVLGALPTQRTQNFLIETRGGSVNWLEPNRTTTLAAFDAIVNGFSGFIGAQTVNSYILNGDGGPQPGLIASLQAIFNAIPGFVANSTVRISTNPADFVGQQYSTIFISSSFEPAAFFNNGLFGAVQRVDAFNSNRTDQGVVFLPALNSLGNAPDQAGIDAFTRQLTGIVARQMGQLMGLPITNAGGNLGGPTRINAMAFNAQANDPGAAPNAYAINAADVFLRRASGAGGFAGATTQTFFVGNLNPQQALQRIFWVP
ncbi:MAG: hypothetical protein KIT68_01430 [Phycisphaeraceae bacterium]|nr:hypothetical protein [Phycisphaeraceae bacterium]